MGGLSPYSLYDFRVAAVNTIGQGPSSDVVEARTAEQAPSSPPRQVRHCISLSFRIKNLICGKFCLIYDYYIGKKLHTLPLNASSKTYTDSTIKYFGFPPIHWNMQKTRLTPVSLNDSRFTQQVRGRMLSTTTAIIHWDEPEEPNGQVVGYRVYYTSDSTLPVNQVSLHASQIHGVPKNLHHF